MADNVSLNSSTSDTIAADDIAGVKYQRVKLTHGADGTADDVTTSSPLPVVLAGTNALPTGAATAAKQASPSVAGTPSDELITVQGNPAGYPLPVSGTVTAQLSAGTNTIGNVGLAPRTSGGLSSHVTISAASTNATNVKSSAGQVYGVIASNVNAAIRYLKLYNKASAPTVGTDTPVAVIPLPGATPGGGAIVNIQIGLACSAGIAFAITSGIAHSDTGAISASETAVTIFYA